jgi:hypothetical protein
MPPACPEGILKRPRSSVPAIPSAFLLGAMALVANDFLRLKNAYDRALAVWQNAAA